jgi:hypothetical protein
VVTLTKDHGGNRHVKTPVRGEKCFTGNKAVSGEVVV